MILLDASIERRGRIDAPRGEVWPVLADLGGLDRLIPRAEAHERLDGDRWRWVLEPVGGFGRSFRPEFTVTYELDAPRALHFRTDADGAHGDAATGTFALEEDGAATHIVVRLEFGMEVQLPSLVRGPARAMLGQELGRLGDGFIDNLRREVSRSRNQRSRG